jgi:hypothetical protein
LPKEENEMKKLLQMASSAVLIGLILAACSPLVPATNDPATSIPGPAQMTTRPAPVESVEVQILHNRPFQVNALIRGHLAESCATLGGSQVTYASNVFQIAVVAVSPSDRGCIQIVTPFETTIALDASNLPAGSYTVIANGVSAVFALPPESTPPTAAPTAVPTARPTSSVCTDAATFVKDMTIPDYTLMAPGVAFTKTWRLKNSGSCTWDSNYLVAYIRGTTVSQQPGYWILQKGETVAPGQSVNVSVGMTAPVENGNYTSYWGLRPENGQLMPISGGANGNSFYVRIRVEDASNEPPADTTTAAIDIEPEQGSGPACTADSTYFVHASITANGPITAAYEIGSTAGQISAGNFQTPGDSRLSPYVTGTLVFNQADTKTISLRFVGPYPHPDDITVMVRVNGAAWHSAKLSCP